MLVEEVSQVLRTLKKFVYEMLSDGTPQSFNIEKIFHVPKEGIIRLYA